MIYTSTTKYMDIDTGEQITRKRAKTHYIKIKTIKHATTKWKEGTCHIEYTIQCARDRQRKLFN